MRNIIRLFTGINAQYYFRQLFFALIISALVMAIVWNGVMNDGVLSLKEKKMFVSLLVFYGINSLLYPYARLAYEQIVDFILGDNFFLVDGIFFLMTKMITMFLCFAFAVFLAPIGLLFIYLHQRKEARKKYPD